MRSYVELEKRLIISGPEWTGVDSLENGGNIKTAELLRLKVCLYAFKATKHPQ